MIPQDRAAFLEAVIGLAELKGKQLSAPALELYWRAMQHWCIEDFKQAAQHLVRTCEFMPTPKDFEDLRRAAEPTPGEAWALALSGALLEPGSRIARAAAIVGGQQHMRMADIERDLPHIQRRFVAAYEDLADADQTRAALPQLASPDVARLAANAVKRLP